MSLVRPTLMSDVLKLKQKFIHKYRSRTIVFYISVVNKQMKTEDMTFELINSWNIHSKNAIAKFNEFLKEYDVLNKFVVKMFWIWDENHRLQALRFVIDKHHSGEAT